MGLDALLQPLTPFPHSERHLPAVAENPFPLHCESHLRRRGHGRADGALVPKQTSRHGSRMPRRRNGALLQHHRRVGRREHFFQPLLRHHHCGAQFAVQSRHRGQEIAGGDGVKLAGRLVQQQHIGGHRHHRCQVQQLFLAARKLGHVFVEPVLNAEVAGHFRHPGAHHRLGGAQVFQPEGQFVPHFVGDDLGVGVLHNEADTGRLLPQGHIFQGSTVEQNSARQLAMGSQHRFHQAQKRGLAATAGAAQHYVAAPLYRKRNLAQSRLFPVGIAKTHPLNINQRQTDPSLTAQIQWHPL